MSKRGGKSYSTYKILCKKIDYIIVDGAKYIKPTSNENDIKSTYYKFIKSNLSKCTELSVNNIIHIYLKHGYFHSYDTYCLKSPDTEMYATNGVRMNNENVVLFKRMIKIKKIIENFIKK